MKKLPITSPINELKLFETIEVETKNVCTRTCWFCKWGQLRAPEDIVEMSWEAINKIINDLVRLNFNGRLSWYGTNEPLSDRRIFDILKISKEKLPKAYLALTSNGDLINQDVYDRLVANGLDRLGISIYDDRTMKKVLAIKGDKLTLMNMMDPKFEERIITNKGGIIEVPDTAPSEKWVKSLKYYREDCQRPFTAMWVRPNGDATLCCEDSYGDIVFENVMNKPLDEIWFTNEKLNDYRNKLATTGRKGLKMCDGCTHKGFGNLKTWLTTDHPLRIK